jgi:hypothetical protein
MSATVTEWSALGGAGVAFAARPFFSVSDPPEELAEEPDEEPDENSPQLVVKVGSSNTTTASRLVFDFIIDNPKSIRDIPQNVCGQRSPDQGPAITEDGDQFIEVFDLQSVVEGEAKPVRSVKER